MREATGNTAAHVKQNARTGLGTDILIGLKKRGREANPCMQNEVFRPLMFFWIDWRRLARNVPDSMYIQYHSICTQIAKMEHTITGQGFGDIQTAWHTLHFPSNGCNQTIRKFCQICLFRCAQNTKYF
jgi:hypothetical protein